MDALFVGVDLAMQGTTFTSSSSKHIQCILTLDRYLQHSHCSYPENLTASPTQSSFLLTISLPPEALRGRTTFILRPDALPCLHPFASSPPACG
jgi:hypothetical protein